MSVFDGEIDFNSTYMVDFNKKERSLDRVPIPLDDNCLIVGVSRDALRAKEKPRRAPDVLCPVKQEYYKDAVARIKAKHPRLAQLYLSKDVDPTPIDHELQDQGRTEYLTKYCSRDLPFMSVDKTRRALATKTLVLPDDVVIPETTHTGSHRPPPPEKYVEHSSKQSMRPKFDDSLKEELRRILRIRTGETCYGMAHGLLAQEILEKHPFGEPREEPKYGRWKNPLRYTYRL